MAFSKMQGILIAFGAKFLIDVEKTFMNQCLHCNND
jgi:hypothetical protein